MTTTTVGVLALQGDVAEHLRMLAAAGAIGVPVRRPEELAQVDAMVVPGGESTTIYQLAVSFDMAEPLRERIRSGMPTFGTCAGMILLADRIEDGITRQQSFGGIDMTVRRNAFGRQVDSFEADVAFADLPNTVPAVFIRAPWVEKVGERTEVLATVRGGPADGRIVAVRQGRLIATAFHPEVSGDDRIHRYFVDLLR